MDLGVLYKVVPLTSIIMNSPLSRAITLVIVFIILLIFGSAFNILNLDNSNIKESSDIKIENSTLILDVSSPYSFSKSSGSGYSSVSHVITDGDSLVNKISVSGTDSSSQPDCQFTFYKNDGSSFTATSGFEWTGSNSFIRNYLKSFPSYYQRINDNSFSLEPTLDLSSSLLEAEYVPCGFTLYYSSLAETGFLEFETLTLDNTNKTILDFSYCILNADTTHEENLDFLVNDISVELDNVFTNPNTENFNQFDIRIDLERVDEETSPTLSNLNLECSSNENDLKYDEDEDSSSSSSSSITLSSYSSNSYGNGSGFWANYGLTIKNWFNSFTSWVKSFFVAEEVY